PQVHLREAAELAYYGAKVLHPRALIPLIRQNVAIRIRPFADPASLGTEISRRRTLEQYPVKALSAIPRQALLTAPGSGMLGVAGRVFSALAEAGINVIATAQGSSELNLSLVVDGKEAPRAQRVVHAAFQLSKIGGGAVAHPERSDVVLLGFGQIGRALAPMIAKVKREALTLRIVGLIDSSGFVFDADGFSPRRLAALGAAKAKGAPLAKATGGRRASAAE